MQWWYWIILGLFLLAGEVTLTGGFDLFFFGVSALVVGAVAGLEWVTDFTVQCIVFSILSVVSLVLFRRPLLSRFRLRGSTHQDLDNLLGENVNVLGEIAPGTAGKGELRGTTWTVRNAGPAPLMRGQRAVVQRVDGLTLWVRPE